MAPFELGPLLSPVGEKIARSARRSRRAEGKPRSGAAGSSWNSTVTVRQGYRDARIEGRFVVQRMAKWHWSSTGEESSFDRVCICGKAQFDEVPLMSDGEKVWASGVMACGSVWTCPVCSAAIKARRADEIECLAVAHASLGTGSISMLTLTLRHKLSMPLGDSHGALAGSWRRLQRLKSWSDFSALLVGFVQAEEITHGKNGWHPHKHLLLFVKAGVSQQQVDRLWGPCEADWIRLCSESLGIAPSKERAARLEHVGTDGLQAAARYLSKIAKELTAGDMKSGRDPFSLLDQVELGEERAIALWFEYANTMKGARSISFSAGLRELYGIGGDLTDEQIVEDRERVGIVVAYVLAEEWEIARACGDLSFLLTGAESMLQDGILSIDANAPPHVLHYGR